MTFPSADESPSIMGARERRSSFLFASLRVLQKAHRQQRQPREEEEVLSWQKPGRCGVEEAGLLAHSDESHSGQKTYPCPCLFYQCLKALRDLDACIRLVETLSCHSLPWKLGSHVGTNARAWGCSPPPLLKETLKMQTR